MVNETVTAPSAITDLSAMMAGDGWVVVFWSTPENGGGEITRYQVRYKAGSGAYESWTDMPISDADTTAYTVTDLVNGTDYTFQVRARNGNGVAAPSDETSARPVAENRQPLIDNLQGYMSDRSVVLGWSYHSLFYASFQYRMRKAGGDYGAWTDFPEVRRNVRWRDAQLDGWFEEGAEYVFQVRAVFGEQTSPGSSEARLRVLRIPWYCGPPGELAVSRFDDEAVLLWNDPRIVEGATILSYEFRQGSGGVYGQWTAVPDSDEDTEGHTVTGLSLDQDYTFQIRAVTDLGPGEASRIAVADAPYDSGEEDAGATALSASWTPPSSHDGTAFEFDLRFSEEAELSYVNMRDAVVTATGARVTEARRLEQGSNIGWRLRVQPDSADTEVSLSLSATTDCPASSAVCAADGRALLNGLTATVATQAPEEEVQEPVSLTVAFEEMPGTHDGTAFTFGLTFSEQIPLSYRTLRDTAFTVTGGRVTEAVRRVTTGEETLTLTLSNASGAWIADGEATGTIENDDAMPKAWLARFGRTVSEQMLDGVKARLGTPRTPGGQATLAGRALPSWTPGGGDAGTGAAVSGARADGMSARDEREAEERLAALGDWLSGREPAHPLQSRGISNRELLTGSAFSLTGGTAGGGFLSVGGRTPRSTGATASSTWTVR